MRASIIPCAFVGVLVTTFTTPPNASEPYCEDAAPRTISIRSILSIIKPFKLFFPSKLIGAPLTNTKELLSKPRIFVRLSMPPNSNPKGP